MANAKLAINSRYIEMRDGVRLAVSTWRESSLDAPLVPRPAVLTATRYWRAMAFTDDHIEHQKFYPQAAFLWARGFVFVSADMRGSGASFGTRSGEASEAEIEDIGELIQWIAQQDWCNGEVATIGTSYTANTTLLSLSTGAPSLKLGVCRAPDFDVYRHLLAPGGIVNDWFVKDWGAYVSALDANDLGPIQAHDDWPGCGTGDKLLGVRPVDEDPDGVLLQKAVAGHRDNFNVAASIHRLTYIDDYLDQPKSGTSTELRQSAMGTPGEACIHNNAYFYQEKIVAAETPLVIRCGWYDGATALGALSYFKTMSNPVRVILGPWNHVGDSRVDPFMPGDGRRVEPISTDDRLGLIAQSLELGLNGTQAPSGEASASAADQYGVVDYYTLGENKWKSTRVWPLAQTQRRRFYLSADHRLSDQAPISDATSDRYSVDPSASTGVNNRWYCQMHHPEYFLDRCPEDKKLLVYDTPPLAEDTEITGHPVVQLYLSSTATDGQIFAYLETIDPNGRVRLLTDGQLRLLHRKVSEDPSPFQLFGPYHSFLRKDAAPMEPGRVEAVSFDLLPLSVLLKKGQRLRLAIAGSDKDTFVPIPGCESPEITVERNPVYASYLELPLIQRKEK